MFDSYAMVEDAVSHELSQGNRVLNDKKYSEMEELCNAIDIIMEDNEASDLSVSIDAETGEMCLRFDCVLLQITEPDIGIPFFFVMNHVSKMAFSSTNGDVVHVGVWVDDMLISKSEGC